MLQVSIDSPSMHHPSSSPVTADWRGQELSGQGAEDELEPAHSSRDWSNNFPPCFMACRKCGGCCCSASVTSRTAILYCSCLSWDGCVLA